MGVLEQQRAQNQQTEPSPAAAAGEKGIGKRQIVRGADNLNEPLSAGKGRRMAQEAVRPGQGAAVGEDQEATEDEQAEFERAMKAVSKVLYEEDRTSNAIIRQLTPDEKVGSVAKASMLLLNQLDQKLDFDEVIIPQLTQEIVDRIIDLYENTQEDEFADNEAQAAFGAAWEGVMEMYGIDEEDYAELTAGMSDEQFGEYEGTYKQMLGEA